ncbi:MAG: hypothetical protein AB7F50_03555 [Fimbriimonadaceae bacterium]
MSEFDQSLAPFRRRLRWVGAWAGFAYGMCAGAAIAGAWVALDLARIAYADWSLLAMVVGGCAVLGAVAGALWRWDTSVVARSVDLRAGLKDRAVSAEREEGDGFIDAVRHDAAAQVAGLNPKELYPIRPRRTQAIAAIAVAAVALVFGLGNSPLVRGPKSAEERAELAKAGQAVVRVAKPLGERPKTGPLAAGDRKLASDMNRLGEDLQRGRVSREEALRTANKLADQAEKQAREHAEEAKAEFAKAQTALQKYQQSQLSEAGVDMDKLEGIELSQSQMDFIEKERVEQGWKNERSASESQSLDQMGLNESAKALAELSPEQREQLRQAASERMAELQAQIDKMDALPPEQRKAMEQQRAEARRQMEEMQDLMKSLEMSEEVEKALRELAQSPEAQELAKKLQEMQEMAQQQAEGEQMDPEQLKQMAEQMKELAEQLKNPAVREAMKEMMKKALEEMETGQMSRESAQQMAAALGMMQQMQGGNGKGSQDQFADTGKVVRSENEMETKGKTTKTGVRGEWGKDGKEYNVELKAPTQVGSKSTVPYRKVLPGYKKAAESAVDRKQVPREHEKRVKEYFDSLGKG